MKTKQDEELVAKAKVMVIKYSLAMNLEPSSTMEKILLIGGLDLFGLCLQI